jgi:hypothetical protein
VRKIRDFRINLSHKELRRRVRTAVDLCALGLSDERRLEAEVHSFASKLRPAVVFETFGPDSAETAGLSPIPGLAHTLGLATLGPTVSQALDEARTESEPRGRLYGILAAMALEHAVQFVAGLLREETEAERCELSPLHVLSEPAAIGLAHRRLEASKIGVSFEAGRLVPEHSSAFCLSWISRRGSRKPRPKAPADRKP